MAKPMVVGFVDDAALVMSVGKRLSVEPVLAKEGKYPAGEMAVEGPAKCPSFVLVVGNVWEAPSSPFKLLVLAEGLRAAGAKKIHLLAPWIAYGRQDRMAEPGEAPAGLAVAKALVRAFDRIVTLDAHSPMFQKAFGPKLKNLTIEKELFHADPFDILAAPDFGAKSRVEKLAHALSVPEAVVQKQRVGHRVMSKLASPHPSLLGKRIVLLDDMADSGSTLIAAAHALKEKGASSVSAFVTHALDLGHLRVRMGPDLARLDAVFDHASGRIDQTALERLTSASL